MCSLSAPWKMCTLCLWHHNQDKNIIAQRRGIKQYGVVGRYCLPQAIWATSGSVENYRGLWLCMVAESSMESKTKNIKKQPWSNVECFAFGGATVRFASLETSFHTANHTITPPPSYEGYPLCHKDKNRSPFHGEKPLIVKWFLGKKPRQISQKDFAW